MQPDSSELIKTNDVRFHAIMDAAPECIKIVAPDGRLMFMNQAGLLMVEAPSFTQVEGASILDVIAPDYKTNWMAHHDRICKGESLNWQFEIIGLGGTRKFMETHAVPLPNGDGTFSQLAVTRDITQRKQAEDTLKRNELILKAQNRAHELAMHSSDLSGILNIITSAIEEYANNQIFASILMADKDGKYSSEGSAPEVPANVWEKSASEKEEVVVADIESTILPAEFKTNVLARGLKACWFSPIVSSGNTLATFAIFYTQPRQPTPEDRRAVELLAHTAGIIIEWFREVKERKQTEEALRIAKDEAEKSKRLYETITGSTPDLIYVFDLQYRFTYANDALLKMWNSTWDQSIGKGLLENGYEPWHAEMHEREIDEVVATQKPIRGEVSFPHATLGRRIYDYIFVPVFDKDGNVEAVAGTTRDITDLKITENALKESEAKFKRFYESNMLPIAFWNVSGKVYECNDAFANLVGYTQQEIMDGHYNWMNATAPECSNLHHENVKKAVEGKMFIEPYELELVRPDGNRIHVLAGYALLEGSKENGVAFLMDITIQKSLMTALEYRVVERTKELNEANFALKQSNEDLLQFAHVASHDLKEPVRKVKTFGYRLQGELNDANDKAKGYIDKILSSASRMAAMIEGILSYSTINASTEMSGEVDLNKLLEDIQSDLEVVIEQKHAMITSINLPIITGNRFLLYQLFLNLINNALKFSRPDLEPRINIEGNSIERAGKKYLRLTIEDNGIGFEQCNAERIFETFSRLNPKDKFEGTGLGLALCKKIVQRHNGTITAFGEKDKGAKFIIELPLEINPSYYLVKNEKKYSVSRR